MDSASYSALASSSHGRSARWVCADCNQIVDWPCKVACNTAGYGGVWLQEGGGLLGIKLISYAMHFALLTYG